MEGELMMFVAINFENGLRPINQINLHENVYGRPFKLKRIHGTNYFVVGCQKHLAIIKLQEERVFFIKGFMDIHSDNVLDLCVVKNMIFSKGRNESTVKVTYFGDHYETVAKAKDESEGIDLNISQSQPPLTTATLSEMELPICRLGFT